VEKTRHLVVFLFSYSMDRSKKKGKKWREKGKGFEENARDREDTDLASTPGPH